VEFDKNHILAAITLVSKTIWPSKT